MPLCAHAHKLHAACQLSGVCALADIPMGEQMKMFRDGCLWNTTRCSKAVLKVMCAER